MILMAIAIHFTFSINIRSELLSNTGNVINTATKIPKERRLGSFDDELQTGSLYVQQLENTNANLNEVNSNTRLQTSMKRIGTQFSEIEERLDDFRDSIARKLNELHMSLQRPKIPIMGPAAMMLHPSMNSMVPSTLNNANDSFMPNASQIGPSVNSEYYNPIVNSSQVSNAVLKSQPSMIGSQYVQSLSRPVERRLLQRIQNRPKVL